MHRLILPKKAATVQFHSDNPHHTNLANIIVLTTSNFLEHPAIPNPPRKSSQFETFQKHHLLVNEEKMQDNRKLESFRYKNLAPSLGLQT